MENRRKTDTNSSFLSICSCHLTKQTGMYEYVQTNFVILRVRRSSFYSYYNCKCKKQVEEPNPRLLVVVLFMPNKHLPCQENTHTHTLKNPIKKNI